MVVVTALPLPIFTMALARILFIISIIFRVYVHIMRDTETDRAQRAFHIATAGKCPARQTDPFYRKRSAVRGVYRSC